MKCLRPLYISSPCMKKMSVVISVLKGLACYEYDYSHTITELQGLEGTSRDQRVQHPSKAVPYSRSHK